MIELQGVLKRFGALTAVDHVDLGIDEGERIVVIGPSGSGKTTLLRMVNFLETIDDGKILIDGREAGYRRDRKGRLVLEKQQVICALRSEIGMVFQHFHLFPHMTVLQNVMEGPVTVKKKPREDARATALDLLGKVGLLDKQDVYPSFLSGGQKQRLLLARALYKQPRFLLLDEYTSHLDFDTEAQVQHAINALGCGRFIITHREHSLSEGDEIWRLQAGQLVRAG